MSALLRTKGDASIVCRFAAATDRGLVREQNEDAIAHRAKTTASR